MTDRTLVPIHVQTTDDEADAAITAVGVALPSTCRLFAVADAAAGTDAKAAEASPSVDDSLREAAGRPIRCSVHEDERGLLAALSRFGHDRVVKTEPLLVTDDGGAEREAPVCWSFRNRAARIDPACPFVGLPYADVAPLADRTTRDAGRDADVGDATDRRSGGGRPAVDAPPASAAEETAEGAGPLLARSLAALLRTDALLEAARRPGRSAGRDSDRTRSDAGTRREPSDDARRGAAPDGTPRLTPPDATPRLAPPDGGPR